MTTLKIFMNNNVDMSKGKYAAQAVHAALNAAGIEHGSVVVLGGPKKLVESLNTTIRDAGRTELKPGTLTAGTDWKPENKHSEDEILILKKAAGVLRSHANQTEHTEVHEYSAELAEALDIIASR